MSESISRIAVIADLHAKPKTLDHLLRELDTFLAFLKADLCPDLLVVLGDIIHGGYGQQEDQEVLTAVVERFDQSLFPVRFVPGNHDVTMLSRSTLVDIFGHSLWSASDNLIFLDSTAPSKSEESGRIGYKQRRALAKSVDQADSPLVFVHHPLGNRDVSDNRWFHDRPDQATCADRVEVNKILSSIDPRAVINAHLHWSDHVIDEGTHHFTVNAFNKELSSEEDGAYAVLDVNDGLTVTLVEGSGLRCKYYVPFTG